MAPGMAIADPRVGKLGLGLGFAGGRKVAAETTVSAAEEMRKKNEELEREVRERREREEVLRRELERTRAELRAVEEAEERLCTQLGELEAEAVVQAQAYHRRIQDLAGQLARALQIIRSSSKSL